MKFSRKFLALLSLILLTFVFSACRTKTQKKPVTNPTTVTDTAPDVPMTATSGETVDSRTDDFVNERPNVAVEELPSDLEALNKMVQERGMIRDAFFQYDAATISTDAQEALTTSAAWLKAHPQYNLLVEGHCDERGTEQYNLALGDRRANTAKDYLVTLGIDAGRIRTVSYGEERPFDPGSDESAHAANRRAHLVITGR